MIYKMKAFDLFGFQVEIDEVATKEWYDKVPRGIVVYDNRDIYDAWNDRRKRD